MPGNASDSNAPANPLQPQKLPPEALAKLAQKYTPQKNIGVAYTYNEPLIHYDYVLNCAKAVRAVGLMNVLVTNGLINPKPLATLLPFIDALNIDLKGFTDDYYTRLVGCPFPNKKSALTTVMETITQAQKHCHIEITTLVVPGENEGHIEPIAQWLAGISPEIPYHISRFFPRHNYTDRQPTPPESLFRLADNARKYLKYVYVGNV
jgi:pyruvate formate lyase activating enzyme